MDIAAARSWYPQADPVHGFDHVLRVYRLAERLALAEGADLEIVRAAALLHDVQVSAAPAAGGQAGAGRPGHQHGAAQFARRVLQAEGWTEERISAVEHCIQAHRFRDASQPPQTLEAQVLFDADKLDAIGATGAARAIAYAAHAGQPFYSPPSTRFLESGQEEDGEPHSAYHEYLFKLRKLKERLHTETARALAQERHRRMTDFFEQLALEAGEG
ncbi:MAG: HD domain-containing protein [Anaerolineales bacterium]|nr:HD domain-containing protein [Anaerolineales bacterium]